MLKRDEMTKGALTTLYRPVGPKENNYIFLKH